jgi:hypothetical protein
MNTKMDARLTLIIKYFLPHIKEWQEAPILRGEQHLATQIIVPQYTRHIIVRDRNNLVGIRLFARMDSMEGRGMANPAPRTPFHTDFNELLFCFDSVDTHDRCHPCSRRRYETVQMERWRPISERCCQ